MRLMPPTKVCKICFKNVKINDVCRLFDDRICICSDCQQSLEPKFISFKVDHYKAIAIYEYNEFIKKQIYLYKGCYDYEMRVVFLNLFFKELGVIYKGYKMITIPSYEEDDKRRGFNHVVEAFEYLGLKRIDLLEKTAHHKQTERNAKKRKEIHKFLRLKKQIDLSKERVLLVDDIYTTGSTMKSAINLVEKLHPKEIKILVLAKTTAKKSDKSNTNVF